MSTSASKFTTSITVSTTTFTYTSNSTSNSTSTSTSTMSTSTSASTSTSTCTAAASGAPPSHLNMPGHKRIRISSLQSCLILNVPVAVLSAGLFPFLGSSHLQFAQTCHGFLSLSGCSRPHVFFDDQLDRLTHFVVVAPYIAIRSRHVSDEGLAHLRRLPLQALSLKQSLLITDSGISSLLLLLQSTLHTLVLQGCPKLTDAALCPLKTTALISLTLCDIAVTGACLASIPTSLRKLSLTQCAGVNDNGLSLLKDHQLQELTLNYLNITDAGMQFIQDMPLRHLEVTDGTGRLTDNSASVIAKLNLLPTLVLNDCNWITEAGLRMLQNKPLQDLTLFHCKQITDEGLKTLTTQTLFLYSQQLVTGRFLAYIKNLHALRLQDCNNITISHIPLSLKEVTIFGCSKVTHENVVELRQKNIDVHLRQQKFDVHNVE